MCMDFVLLVTGGSLYDVDFSIIMSSIILIYIMLPGVRGAFGTDQAYSTGSKR